MHTNSDKLSGLVAFKNLIITPIESLRHWGIIVLVAILFVFAPQVRPPNDWYRNTIGLALGLNIYQDPNAVYPPWALVFLWLYYLITAAGSRIASVLVLGWHASQQKWSLLHFLAMIASPFFLWTMGMSNLDVLVMILPVVLWEFSDRKTWHGLGKGLSLVILLVKPQGGFLMVLYLIWQSRQDLRKMLVPFLIALLAIVPVSLLGKPPLVLQWLDNLFYHPSSQNLTYWQINNVSLTALLGIWQGVCVFVVGLGGVIALMRSKHKPWERNHTYASIFLLSILLGPYASNQSVIVPLAFLPSWPALLIQYALTFTLSYLGIYQKYNALWALLLGLAALWFYKPNQNGVN